MRILLLCEGDAETWDSWSGLSRSIVVHLRALRHDVSCGDVEPRGVGRWVTALRSFARPRARWWVRYHVGLPGFRARSRRADRLVSQQRVPPDVILQIGASFDVANPSRVPRVLLCDSNIELAREGAASGYSEAAVLRPDEISEVFERERRVYDRADRIYTTSDRLRKTFVDVFGVAGDRVETVYAGPNFAEGDAPAVPERPSDGPPTILFVGRAFHRKGGDVLVEAFDEVRRCVPDARLRIIGPRMSPTEIRAQPGVEFVGFVDQSTAEGRRVMRESYLGATVFCLPTRFEPFGVVFLEAMHYGLPCVGPRAWAVPEIIEDGVTGRIFPPEDAASLASCLVELLMAPDLARAFGRAGRERLLDRFTWAHVVRRMTASMAAL